MTSFPQEDLDTNITQSARDAICDLILAWAAFDTMISYWMGLTFGLDIDTASILIGNMDTKTKIDRMKAIFVHLDAKAAVASLNTLSKLHGDYTLSEMPSCIVAASA